MFENLINDIINNLDDSFLKKRYLNIPNKNKYTGHCYIATEALYYLLPDNERKKYKPAILKVNGDTHWFLYNSQDNIILDPTKNQFNFELDYTKMKNHAFLTTKPSKRTLRLINNILNSI